MVRLADLWAEFRAGKPVSSKSQGIKSIKFLKDDPEYGDCILDERGCCENFCIEMNWLDAADWEIVPEPSRVADYFVPVKCKWMGHCDDCIKIRSELWEKQTHPVGQQPEGAVMVPNSERNQNE